MIKEITNTEDLLGIEKEGEYILKNDIDFDNQVLNYICKYFKGKIDGAGHSIKNIVLSDEIWGDEQTLALFINMSRATIKNIKFENIKLEYEAGCYSPKVALIGGECSDCVFSDIQAAICNKSDKETPMFYDLNNCENANNTIKCNGKKSRISKYEE